jgi:hypothetical protein
MADSSADEILSSDEEFFQKRWFMCTFPAKKPKLVKCNSMCNSNVIAHVKDMGSFCRFCSSMATFRGRSGRNSKRFRQQTCCRVQQTWRQHCIGDGNSVRCRIPPHLLFEIYWQATHFTSNSTDDEEQRNGCQQLCLYRYVKCIFLQAWQVYSLMEF